MTTKYDHELPHHNPDEGFDHSEPAARKITSSPSRSAWAFTCCEPGTIISRTLSAA